MSQYKAQTVEIGLTMVEPIDEPVHQSTVIDISQIQLHTFGADNKRMYYITIPVDTSMVTSLVVTSERENIKWELPVGRPSPNKMFDRYENGVVDMVLSNKEYDDIYDIIHGEPLDDIKVVIADLIFSATIVPEPIREDPDGEDFTVIGQQTPQRNP